MAVVYRKHLFVLVDTGYIVCKCCCREIYKGIPKCSCDPTTPESPFENGLDQSRIIDENPKLPRYAEEE
jgi:hypothetical protein